MERNSTKTTTSFYTKGTKEHEGFLKYPSWCFVIFVVIESLAFDVIIFVLFQRQTGDIVFNPFCGCATTCVAAQQLDRKWVILHPVS